MRSKILALLREAGDSYLSGEEMAKRLGVPLNELKTVAPARRDGIIFALHDGGYTVREIERYTGISKSTVSRIVRAYARVKAQAEGSE